MEKEGIGFYDNLCKVNLLKPGECRSVGTTDEKDTHHDN